MRYPSIITVPHNFSDVDPIELSDSDVETKLLPLIQDGSITFAYRNENRYWLRNQSGIMKPVEVARYFQNSPVLV